MTSRSERYLPTIALVLAEERYPSLRLPSYRISHRLRFHPYPQYTSPCQDSLTTTVEHDSIPLSATGSPLPTVIEEDLEMAILSQMSSAKQSESPHPRARRLSALVMDLAFAVRRKLSSICAHDIADAEAENQDA